MKLTNQEKNILSQYDCANKDFKIIEKNAKFVVITTDYNKRIRHKDFKKMDKRKFLWNLTYCIFHKSSTAYIYGCYYYFNLNK